MMCGCKAYISDSNPRAEIWKEVFGESSFPIKWPVYLAMATFPGKRFVNGDGNALTEEQKVKLSELMARKFEIPAKEVLKNLEEPTVPILDEGVTLSFCRKHSMMVL